MSRIMSFSKQRMLFTFVIFGIGFAFTTAILWSHIEGVIGKPGYQTLAKAGLILLPAVALIMTIWELFVDKVGPGRLHNLHPAVKHLIDWCFWGSLILLIAELIHAGALLKYESSTAEQKTTIAAVGDAQAKIAGATTSAAIESAGKTAQQLNAAGQTRTAGRIVAAGKDTAAAASSHAGEEVSKVAKDAKPDTFLPAWYIGGGMYVALPLLAALFFGVTMALARQAAPHVDADDDGIPDAQQHQPAQEPAQETGGWQTSPVRERTYRHLPDGRREIVHSTYDPKEVGQILDPEPAREFANQKPTVKWQGGRIREDAQGHFDTRRESSATPENAKTHVSSKIDSGIEKTHVSSNPVEGVKALRETLKVISFYTPGQSFKVDLKEDCVWIRAMRAVQGTQETTHSVRAELKILDDAVRMPAEEFRARLEKFLVRAGFKL